MKLVFSSLVILLCLSQVRALTCDANELKITIKTDPEEYTFDVYEEYLLQATVAYSMRKYCGDGTITDCVTTNTDVADVTVSNVTERIAMCVEVAGHTSNVVRNAIRFSKPNLNGALLLTDDELFVEGIDPTLEPPFVPDFAYWLIAYIVIFSLILIAGLVVVLYTKFHKSDKGEDEESMVDSVEEHGHTNNVYENEQPEEKSDRVEEEAYTML